MSFNILDIPSDIFAKLLLGTGNVLLLAQASRRARAMVRDSGASVWVDANHSMVYYRSLSEQVHMKRLLQGATALLHCKLKVVLGGHHWRYQYMPQVWGPMLNVCRLHGDCTHAQGDCYLKHANLRDLLELHKLVHDCPHFTCRLCVGGPEVPDSHFVLVVQPMYPHTWHVKLRVGTGGRKLREEPYPWGGPHW